MRTVPVAPFPVESYDTFNGAIEAAMRHALQPKAQAETAQLAGTTIVDGYWTDTDFIIRFSNERLLHVWVSGQSVEWQLAKAIPPIFGLEVERVGAEPVVLRWPPPVGERIMDRSALLAKRRSAEFSRLFVNEMGLLLYCRDHLILWFSAIRRTDIDQLMLFVCEGE